MDTQVTERKTLNVDELRARMQKHGVTVRQLADAAQMYPDNMSTILNGKAGYLGARRIARIEQAIKALGLDTPDEAAESA